MIFAESMLVGGDLEVFSEGGEEESLHDLDCRREQGYRSIGRADAGVLAGLEEGDYDGLLPDIRYKAGGKG